MKGRALGAVTGRSGVGRRDAVALAAYMLRMPVLQLTMTKGYSLKAFRLEIRAALQIAGVQGEHVCLIIEDHNLTDPLGVPPTHLRPLCRC
jgi:dynein heavy chain 2